MGKHYFGHTKRINNHLLTLSSLKKKIMLILLTMGMLSCFLDGVFALQSLQNFLKRNWMLRQPLLFVYWLPKHPVFSPPFFNTVSQATTGYLLLTVQHLCDLGDAMPCHWSPDAPHSPFTVSAMDLSVFYSKVSFTLHSFLLL